MGSEASPEKKGPCSLAPLISLGSFTSTASVTNATSCSDAFIGPGARHQWEEGLEVKR